MNKFLLSVFVILAIGMAELPSIFGCDPQYLTKYSTTTTTTLRTYPDDGLSFPVRIEHTAEIGIVHTLF